MIQGSQQHPVSQPVSGGVRGRARTYSRGSVQVVQGAVLALLFVWTSVEGQPLSFAEGVLGVLIVFFAFPPMVAWAMNPQRQFPIYESYCLSLGVYYGIPILIGENAAFKQWRFSEEERVFVGVLVLSGLIATKLAYHFFKRRIHRRVINAQFLVMPEKVGVRLLLVYFFLSVSIMTLLAFGLMPDLGGAYQAVRSIANGVGIVSTLVLFRLIGEGTLRGAARLAVYGLLLVITAVNLSTLFLVTTLKWLVPAIMGYAVGKGAVPWRLSLLVIAGILFLTAGKSATREVYWAKYAGPTQGFGAVYQRLSDWSDNSMSAFAGKRQTKSQRLTKRLNLTTMFGVIVHTSPERKPFLGGETYMSLVYLWIPRFVWPDKPSGQEATERLGLYYGIHTKESLKKTSIGLGVLGEAYANFGIAGVMVLSLLFGWLLAHANNYARNVPTLSMRGFMVAPFMVTALAMEHAMGTIVVPLLHMVIAVLVSFSWLMVKRRLDQRKRRKAVSSVDSNLLRLNEQR